jgi:hypothetical protein
MNLLHFSWIIIFRLLSKGDPDKKNLYIGDHLELEIRRIRKKNEGWYRCIQWPKRDGVTRISQLYFLDVVEQKTFEMV